VRILIPSSRPDKENPKNFYTPTATLYRPADGSLIKTQQNPTKLVLPAPNLKGPRSIYQIFK
jgi:hypothetical protein